MATVDLDLGPEEEPDVAGDAFVPLDLDVAREAAMGLIRLGWAIVPCYGITRPRWCSCSAGPTCENEGKHTRLPGWGVDKQIWMTDPRQAEVYWSRERFPPGSTVDNIASVCYGSGHLVADIDYPVRWAVSLAALGLPQPRTLTATTGRGSGARHEFYRVSEAIRAALPKARGNMDMGAGEWRWKAVVVLPPSVHKTGRRYSWLDPSVPVLMVPEQLERPVFRTSGSWGSARVGVQDEVAAVVAMFSREHCLGLYARVLDESTFAVESLAPDSHRRRNTLNAVTYRVGAWVRALEISDQEARHRLVAAGVACGLSDDEATTTVRHALADGAVSVGVRPS